MSNNHLDLFYMTQTWTNVEGTNLQARYEANDPYRSFRLRKNPDAPRSVTVYVLVGYHLDDLTLETSFHRTWEVRNSLEEAEKRKNEIETQAAMFISQQYWVKIEPVEMRFGV